MACRQSSLSCIEQHVIIYTTCNYSMDTFEIKNFNFYLETNEIIQMVSHKGMLQLFEILPKHESPIRCSFIFIHSLTSDLGNGTTLMVWFLHQIYEKLLSFVKSRDFEISNMNFARVNLSGEKFIPSPPLGLSRLY